MKRSVKDPPLPRNLFQAARDHNNGYPSEELRASSRAFQLWADIEDKPHHALRYIDEALADSFYRGKREGRRAKQKIRKTIQKRKLSR